MSTNNANVLESIDERIEEIEADNRLPEDYPEECADVHTNVVLALIQTDLSTELKTLRWVKSMLTESDDG